MVARSTNSTPLASGGIGRNVADQQTRIGPIPLRPDNPRTTKSMAFPIRRPAIGGRQVLLPTTRPRRPRIFTEAARRNTPAAGASATRKQRLAINPTGWFRAARTKNSIAYRSAKAKQRAIFVGRLSGRPAQRASVSRTAADGRCGWSVPSVPNSTSRPRPRSTSSSMGPGAAIWARSAASRSTGPHAVGSRAK